MRRRRTRPLTALRTGLGFGHPNPTTGRRTGFSIMLSTMFVLGSGGVRAAQTAGSSGGSTSVYQGVTPYGGLGIAPLLLFGFESR